MESKPASSMFAHALDGRVALVTGGDSGIGAASAKALADAGADVAIIYLEDEVGAHETCAAIEASGRRALALRSDVREEAEVNDAFNRIEHVIGKVDILVNSAGINTYGIKVVDLSFAQWGDMLHTDLTGTFLAARRCIRALQESGKKGAIINISSIHADVVRSGSAAYASAKAGVKKFTETLALEVAGDGITVNAIAPGMILTPMNQSAKDHWIVRKVKSEFIPLGRPGTRDEVANVVLFLASPAGDYFTGSTLTIDGGLSKMLALGA